MKFYTTVMEMIGGEKSQICTALVQLVRYLLKYKEVRKVMFTYVNGRRKGHKKAQRSCPLNIENFGKEDLKKVLGVTQGDVDKAYSQLKELALKPDKKLRDLYFSFFERVQKSSACVRWQEVISEYMGFEKSHEGFDAFIHLMWYELSEMPLWEAVLERIALNPKDDEIVAYMIRSAAILDEPCQTVWGDCRQIIVAFGCPSTLEAIDAYLEQARKAERMERLIERLGPA